MNIMRRGVLQLNRSMEPLRVISVRHSLKLVCKGKARVIIPTRIEVYPGITAPSVIALVDYAKVPYKRPMSSRKNIFTRDGFKCLYCGAHGSKIVLELEHIVPKSRGGNSEWSNLCCSCHECNQKKKNMTPEEAGMKLIHRPLPATIHTSRFMLKQLGSEIEEWSSFLWNNSKGEERLQFA
jgi:5-methylcytosine-specific restriction endonuclease McrA